MEMWDCSSGAALNREIPERLTMMMYMHMLCWLNWVGFCIGSFELLSAD